MTKSLHESISFNFLDSYSKSVLIIVWFVSGSLKCYIAKSFLRKPPTMVSIDCSGGVTEETKIPFPIVYLYYCSAKKKCISFTLHMHSSDIHRPLFHFKSSLKGNLWWEINKFITLYAVEVAFHLHLSLCPRSNRSHWKSQTTHTHTHKSPNQTKPKQPFLRHDMYAKTSGRHYLFSPAVL